MAENTRIANGRVSHDPAEWPEWARVREFPAMEPTAK